jgi:hypothetical protein
MKDAINERKRQSPKKRTNSKRQKDRALSSEWELLNY